MSTDTSSGGASGTQSLSVMPFIFAAGVLLYGVVNAVAVITAGEVNLRVQNVAGQLPLAGLPEGAAVVWPYHLSVPVALLPWGAVALVKLGEALLPIAWGMALLWVGLVLREAGWAPTIFDGGVRRRVTALRWILFGTALVPDGLRVFGSTWATKALGAGFSTSTPLGQMWIPLFAGYLCLAFEYVLRRGETLQGELDEVI
ncbi:hypothetical protein AAEX63_15125 [Luteococcus sp. H138]|uniref:hypothetical protein n=1 Tax=unclassified Luteococcus TaxID=2639923 RepID=UPI00313DA402